MIESQKILFIDPISHMGHINFNNIYISSLYGYCEKIDFAFKQNYENHLKVAPDSTIYSIPLKYYIQTKNKFLRRLSLYRTLRYLKKNIEFDIYDFIIMSSFEEISLYLVNFKTPLILIHHSNFRSLDSPLKSFFYKKVANKNINIVFEEYMKSLLDSIGSKKTHVVRHGLQQPIDKNILDIPNLNDQFENIEKYNHIIFSPSATSIDKTFISMLLSNKVFVSYLESRNILFILKSDCKIKKSTGNILVINRYLTDAEYKYLFLRSDIIFISYPSSHQYRVSAILFECVANDKLCLVSKIESLLVYKEYFKYDPYFKTIEELIDKTESIISLPISTIKNPYINKKNLQPNFESVLT